MGLANKPKSEVLREHLQNLAQAIRAAFTSEQSLRLVDSDRTSRSQLHGVPLAPSGQPGSIRFLPAVAEFRRTLESESPGRDGHVSSVTRPDISPGFATSGGQRVRIGIL